MLKHARVSWRFLLLLVLAISLLFAFAPTALAASHDVGPSSHLVGTRQYYLALGDSLAFGYQPNRDYAHGYVNDLFQILQSEGVKDVTNLACPGESSTTFISGGSCPYSPFSSQLTAAVNFLKAHPGKVGLVTFNIGSNDMLPDLLGCTVGSNFLHDLNTLDVNLTGTILPALYKALTPKGHISGRIVMMNYYNPFPNCLSNPQFAPAFNEFNAHLADDVNGFGSIVDVFDAFGGITTPNICTYTWVCTVGDIHPTNLGYSVIANTFAAAISPN